VDPQQLPGVFGAFGQGVDSWSSLALLLGMSTTRVAVAFLLVPLITAEIIPATIRNTLFASMALLSLALQAPPANVAAWTSMQWTVLFAKEAFVGGVIGLMFAGMMWAFEAAGQIIDTKVGSSMAQVLDPLSGHQTSLTGSFLARLASWVFMAGGGFMLMVATLIESYAVWPLGTPMPTLSLAGSGWLEAEFGRVMLLTLLIAAPALVLLHLIEGVLGLVNRFAQQLNVFSLSMSIKTIAAVWILWAQVAILSNALFEDLVARQPLVIQTLKRILAP
jgi:type III secretion protein T